MEDKKQILIIYLDDRDDKKSCWVDSYEDKDGFISFIFFGSELSIPKNRIIKIKKVIDDDSNKERY